MAEHTPGPWQWFGNVDCKNIYLASVHGGRRYVMKFGRYGMQGSKPVFNSENGMIGAEELVRYEVCPEATSRDDKRVYRGDILGINHPDAILIATAPELLALAYAYERWEANLVRDNKAWRSEDGLPHLTQELYDELMELQAKRNATIARVEGRYTSTKTGGIS